MAVQHPTFAQSLGPGGNDVLAGDFIEKSVLGQQGQGGEAADHQGADGQHQVPEVIRQFAQHTELVKVLRHQATHRKPVQRRAPSE
ncbi:hypothetical protein D3C79_961100 [compost metagenome]